MSNQQTDLFWELLANPADKSHSHVQNLRQLAREYPQSNLLQSLLFYVGEDDKLSHAVVYADPRLLYKLRHDAGSLSAVSDDQLIKTDGKKPSASDNAASEQENHPPLSEDDLHQQALIDEYQPAEHFFEPQVEEEHAAEPSVSETIEEPETLDDLINYGDEVTTGEHELQPPVTEFHHPERQESEALSVPEAIEEPENLDDLINYGDEITTGEHELQPPVTEFYHPGHKETEAPQPEPVQEAAKPEPHAEQEIELPTPGFFVPGAAEADEDGYSGGDISTRLYETYAETFENIPKPVAEIDDEVFEEIVSIDDINLASPESFAAPADEVPQSVGEAEESTLGFSIPAEEASAAKSRRVDLSDEAEKLMLSNIATTDFFVFDHALSERLKAGDEPKDIASAQPQTTPQSAAEPQNAEPVAQQPSAKRVEYERVTKYFDEKMPYSFMWWLDKTRKEHSGIYQPFVLDTTQRIEKDVPDELQQQYYENIFQLTSVDELERTTGTDPVVFDSRKKEDDIIERFIHDSPQIKPQTSEKLDNENKAKRSSEDQDEIVTETLAHVYADQMLYHKAIRVYQKLMLKFPEKSIYFAGQIDELQKKII